MSLSPLQVSWSAPFLGPASAGSYVVSGFSRTVVRPPEVRPKGGHYYYGFSQALKAGSHTSVLNASATYLTVRQPVFRPSDSSHNSRAGHRAWLRCSSLT
jgi:hypothetical protein